MLYQIFLVENDPYTWDFIRFALNPSEYHVLCFNRKDDFLQYAKNQTPHLILLEAALPGMNQADLIKQIRCIEGLKTTPVIMISEKASEIDKAGSLDAGADDYMEKPLGPLELTARIRALLRRGNNNAHKEFCFRDIYIDNLSHEVYKAGEKINLTLKEYNLLLYLLENKGCVMSREQLSSKLWGNDYNNNSRTLDIHIKTLRKKIGDNPNNPSYITTVRSFGYVIDN